MVPVISSSERFNCITYQGRSSRILPSFEVKHSLYHILSEFNSILFAAWNALLFWWLWIIDNMMLLLAWSLHFLCIQILFAFTVQKKRNLIEEPNIHPICFPCKEGVLKEDFILLNLIGLKYWPITANAGVSSFSQIEQNATNNNHDIFLVKSPRLLSKNQDLSYNIW